MSKYKRVLVATDSFKGSLKAEEICAVIAKGINDLDPQVECILRPLADGGEGTGEILAKAWQGAMREVIVSGPYGNKLKASYGLAGRRAVVEMATCTGLPLVADNLNPGATTTYGVGELILDALEQGSREIILCLGGSCTNDAGCGMLAALGVKFFAEDGRSFIPVGNTLKDIAYLDASGLKNTLREISFKVVCDVGNPLYGKQGAAYIFAPQKGADNLQVELLDQGLRHFDQVVTRDWCKEADANLAGTGAAGGVGYGAKVFLQGELLPGIDIVMETLALEDLVAKADLVITGEGSFDAQSLGGKVISGLGKICKKHKKTLLVLAGAVKINYEDLAGSGITGAFSINGYWDENTLTPSGTRRNLANATKNLWHLLQLKD